MTQPIDISAARIGGSDEQGFRVTVHHFLPGNFGQRRLVSRTLAERFQRIESAKAFLAGMGVAENRMSVESSEGA